MKFPVGTRSLATTATTQVLKQMQDEAFAVREPASSHARYHIDTRGWHATATVCDPSARITHEAPASAP